MLRPLIAGLLLLSLRTVCAGAVGSAVVTPDNANLLIISVNPSSGSLTAFATKPAGRWLDLSDDVDSSTIGLLRHAMQIGSEVWVSDQTSNSIYRFSAEVEHPRFLGTISSVNNPRGMCVVNGEVWVASGNIGSGGGVVRLGSAGNFLASFSAEDPFAVYSLNTDWIVTSNIQQNRLDRFQSSGSIGAAGGVWSGSSLIDFPMQIGRWNESGQDRIVAVGFTGAFPGLYVYNASNGAFVKRLSTIILLPDITVTNPRGFSPIGTGELLWTASQGIFALNPANGSSRVIYTGDNFSCGYLGYVDFQKYCAGDINNDALVDDADFSLFVVAYNQLVCPTLENGYPEGCPSDLNGDGFVDDQDFLIFVTAYNTLICP
ncbi:MAG: hypothetical protein KF691_14430 [Phycisphaeraceae bacterium]|nr:hypothetical protein [Phycisphaeraceae bacterium]